MNQQFFSLSILILSALFIFIHPHDLIYSSTSSPSVQELDLEALELRVHQLINREREKRHLSALDYHQKLVDLARLHSADMAVRNYVAHINPEGHGPTERAKNARFECKIKGANNIFPAGIGENIFMSYLYKQYEIRVVNGVEERTYDWKSVDALTEEIVNNWMQSAGHRENILRKDYTYEGIGIAINGESRLFVTQNFC